MSSRNALVIASMVASFVVAGRTSAQVGENAERRIQATLFVKEDFSTPGLAAVGRRTAGPNGQNLIGFKRSALRPEVILAAAKMLTNSDRRMGERPSRRVDFRIPEATNLGRFDAEELAWAQSVLNQLRDAPTREVPPAGRVRAISISFPAI